MKPAATAFSYGTTRREGTTATAVAQSVMAIEAGYAVGPRIVPAGYALGATGGHCDSTFFPPSFEKEDAIARKTSRPMIGAEQSRVTVRKGEE